MPAHGKVPDRLQPRDFKLRVTFAVAVMATLAIVGGDFVPLGVPGEWTWDRAPVSVETFAGLILAAMGGGVYLAFVLWGWNHLPHAGTVVRRVWLTALPLVSFAWIWVALDATPQPLGYFHAPWVLYNPASSGYFWQARYEVEDPGEFLAGYEELLAEGDYLHIGTHPPGLTLGYLGLLRLLESSPALTNLVLATQPGVVEQGSSFLGSSPLPGVEPMTDSDVACLWLAVVLTQLAVALTTLPIYGLTIRHFDRRTAWLAACLWPLVPASLVFLPKSDVLYPLLATMAAWFWMSACDRQSSLCAALAGLTLWIGMFLSLAFVTVAAVIGVMTSWEYWGRRFKDPEVVNQSSSPPTSSRCFLTPRVFAAAVVGFAVPTLILEVALDINLLRVWSWNLSNHAAFYDHNVRTRWLWLAVNPVELALAVGLPIFILAIVGAWSIRRGEWQSVRTSATIAFLVVWGLLWLSGKNMGEAARLWILLMPWVVLAAVNGVERCGSSRSDAAVVRWLLASQLIVTLITIFRVDGFHFAGMLAG